MDRQNDQNERLEELPAELVAAMRQAERSVTLISADIDRAILRQAEARFSSRTTSRKSRLAAPAWVAIAASLVLAVFFTANREDLTPIAGALYADVNNSGSVDIADVLQLARSSNEVSQIELDQFALRIVSLEQPGDSR